MSGYSIRPGLNAAPIYIESLTGDPLDEIAQLVNNPKVYANKDDQRAFQLFEFDGKGKSANNVVATTAVGLDIDQGGPEVLAHVFAKMRAKKMAFIWTPSFNCTAALPRGHLVVALKTPLTGAFQKERLKSYVDQLTAYLEVPIDKSSSTYPKLYFTGRKAVLEHDYVVTHEQGASIDEIFTVPTTFASETPAKVTPTNAIDTMIAQTPNTAVDRTTAMKVVGMQLHAGASEQACVNWLIRWPGHDGNNKHCVDLVRSLKDRAFSMDAFKSVVDMHQRAENYDDPFAIKDHSTSASPFALDAHAVSFTNMPASVFEDYPHVVQQWLPKDEVTLLAAHGGIGKSYVAMVIAIKTVMGLPVGHLATKQCNVLFVSAEDSTRALQQRVARICKALNVDPNDLHGRLHVLDLSDVDAMLHVDQRNGTGNTETAMVKHLSTYAEQVGAGLVIVDNASDTFDGDEIKRSSVNKFIKSLKRRLARPGRAVLLLVHVKKASIGNKDDSEDYSGSTAWHNGARSRLSLASISTGKMRIEHKKSNYGPLATPVDVLWQQGVPMFIERTEAVTEAESQVALESRDKAKLAVWNCMQVQAKRGVKVSATTRGNTTAYNTLKVFSDFPQEITNPTMFALLIGEMQDEGMVERCVIKVNRADQEVYVCGKVPIRTTALSIDVSPF